MNSYETGDRILFTLVKVTRKKGLDGVGTDGRGRGIGKSDRKMEEEGEGGKGK